MKLHSISIDVTKIPKDRIRPHANGGKYLELTIEELDEPDQYGKNLRVLIGLTKEERAAKVKKTFIGGGKTVWTGEGRTPRTNGGPSAKHTAPRERDDPLADYKDDVLF